MLSKLYHYFWSDSPSKKEPSLEPPANRSLHETRVIALEVFKRENSTPQEEVKYPEITRDHTYTLLESSDQREIFRVTHIKTQEQSYLKKLSGPEDPEGRILPECHHPNIVISRGCFTHKNSLYIKLEQAEQDLGTLCMEKYKVGSYFSEGELRSYFRQIVEAVKYLHDREIAHRDIKLDNILVFPNGVVKLADFSFAKTIKEKGPHSPKGSAQYAAPEICLDKPYDRRADIWSLGISLYAMASFHLPFGGGSIWEINRQVTRGEFMFPEKMKDYSPELSELIKSMLTRDMDERIGSCQEILSHAWFQKE